MRYSDSLSGWITPETEEMAKAVDGLEPEVDHVPLPERLRGVLAWQDLLRSTGPEDAYHMEVCDLIARLVEKLVNAELTASGLLLCEEPGLTADEIMEKYAHLMPPEPDITTAERRPLLDDERTPCEPCGASGRVDAEDGVMPCPTCTPGARP